MKETKELFDKVVSLRDFDDSSLDELIEVRDNLIELIDQITIAKRDGAYFEHGFASSNYRCYREACYDEVFEYNSEINTDCLSISSETQANVLALHK